MTLFCNLRGNSFTFLQRFLQTGLTWHSQDGWHSTCHAGFEQYKPTVYTELRRMHQGDSVEGKLPFQKKKKNCQIKFRVFLNRYNKNTITNIQLERNIPAQHSSSSRSRWSYRSIVIKSRIAKEWRQSTSCNSYTKYFLSLSLPWITISLQSAYILKVINNRADSNKYSWWCPMQMHSSAGR